MNKKNGINKKKIFLLLYFTSLSRLQSICLATFPQVRSISCSAESDGRALLIVNIEGAKQVTLPS